MTTIKEKSYTFESFRKKVTITMEHMPSEQRIQFLASELIREIQGCDEIPKKGMFIPIFVHKMSDSVDMHIGSCDDSIYVPYLYDQPKKEGETMDERNVTEGVGEDDERANM